MFLSILFLILGAIVSLSHAITTCNVLNYGAIANNNADIAPAISKAYENCVSHATTRNPADTILYIPSGTYAIKTTVKFANANYFTIWISGELDLKFDPKLTGTIFLFDHCNYVIWKGSGSIRGNGILWRENGDLNAYPGRPRLVRFQDCDNIDMSGVALYNSPMFHVTIIGDNNVAHDMKIVADHIGETDGFDVSGNNNRVHDVSVENGDECVTVKSPTNGFVAENIQCFYSGGCNVGSFGEGATGVSVQNVYYSNVTQYGGSGGIVLKSYPSASGIVKDLTYVNFKMTDVAYPIKIDNYWCGNKECGAATGDLAFSDITFKSISGSGDGSSRPIIDVSCVAEHECTGVHFEDIHLTKESHVEGAVSISNACGSGLEKIGSCG